MTTTGYIYHRETREVHDILHGDPTKIEAVADEVCHQSDYSLTFAPNFGGKDGLIMCADIIEHDDEGYEIVPLIGV
jgi:hypothetical protein